MGNEANFGAEFVDLTKVNFTPGLLRCIPAELARKYRVLPVAEKGNDLVIVTADPSDLNAIDQLHFRLNRLLEIQIADKDQIDSFIGRLYGDDGREKFRPAQ